LLREQLELKNQDIVDRELVLASVMGNPQDLTGTSLVLDKGARQGIKEGNNVILGNYLIGIVREVTRERSVFDLTISPDVSATVINVEPNSQAEGLAKGDLGTSVRVTKLLPGDAVNEGDVFITSGKDGRFLPGFAVGQVSQVNFGASDPLKNALLSPMLDFTKLEKVFVILE
jgi:rod shape-determining protein MreC